VVTVAPLPPPYRRMLALNSDIEFTTWEAQLDLIRLFAGRGLETAFSYWLFCDPTYTWRMFDLGGGWSREAPVALQLARGGILDTLHSFGGAEHIGGVDFNRGNIQEGYARLADAGVRTTVYSNHGGTRDIQNVGGSWSEPPPPPIDYRNYHCGDLPHHPVYHLDLTRQYGMRHFWLDIDRIRDRAWFSAETDTPSSLFTTQISRDSSPILRFRRTDFNETPWPTKFASQLERALDDPHSGFSVVYNHFGFMRDADDKPAPNPAPYFDREAYVQIDRLVDAQRSGDILVTTTSRLLDFALLQAARPWTIAQAEGGGFVVTFNTSVQVGPVKLPLDWQHLMGFAIELESPKEVELRLGSGRRPAEQWSIGSRHYAGIPWRPLKAMDLLDDALRSFRS
jgi:hypothetical protein